MIFNYLPQKEFVDGYVVYSNGICFSTKINRIVGNKDIKGRWRISFRYGAKCKKDEYINVLVYEFFGKLPDDYTRKKYDIHHLKSLDDNQLWNLTCLSIKQHNLIHDKIEIARQANSGRKQSVEERKKRSLAMKGKNKGSKNGMYRKIPWNKKNK